MIAIDLSKQKSIDIDPDAIHQINLTRNLTRDVNKTMFSLLKEQKKTF